LLFVICYLLFAACATSPGATVVQQDGSPDFSVLPGEAVFYLWADVEKSRPILEAVSANLMSSRDASRILDVTDTAMAAFYPEDASRRFFLAGSGKYPNFGSRLAMGFNRNWKKKKSDTGNRYWYSKSYNLGVAIGKRLAYVSDGDPFLKEPFTPPVPPGFEEFRRACVLSVWVIEPDVRLNSFMDSLGIPIQIPAEDFFIGVAYIPDAETASASKPDECWELFFKIKTRSAAQARSLLTLFSMARLFLHRLPDDEAAGTDADLARLLFARAPEQDGEFLTLRTGPVDEQRIALLFNMFSIYSN